MEFHALPQRRGFGRIRRFIKVDFDSRRRIGRLRSQHIFEHELSALNWRRAVRSGRDKKHAALSENASTRIVLLSM